MVSGRATQIVEGRFIGSMTDDFFPIERLFGTLEEAQERAASFLVNHRMAGARHWQAGAEDYNGTVWYAHAREITIRIRQGNER